MPCRQELHHRRTAGKIPHLPRRDCQFGEGTVPVMYIALTSRGFPGAARDDDPGLCRDSCRAACLRCVLLPEDGAVLHGRGVNVKKYPGE